MNRKQFVKLVMPLGVILIVFYHLYQFALCQSPGNWVAAVLSVPVGLILVMVIGYELKDSDLDIDCDNGGIDEF